MHRIAALLHACILAARTLGETPCSAQSLYLSARAVTFGSARADTDLVKRGDYLVNGILTCGNCHSPKGPGADVAEKAFSGGLSWDEAPFKVTAPNITQDEETGIGNYTDAELNQVLRKGIQRNGRPRMKIHPRKGCSSSRSVEPGSIPRAEASMLRQRERQGVAAAIL